MTHSPEDIPSQTSPLDCHVACDWQPWLTTYHGHRTQMPCEHKHSLTQTHTRARGGERWCCREIWATWEKVKVHIVLEEQQDGCVADPEWLLCKVNGVLGKQSGQVQLLRPLKMTLIKDFYQRLLLRRPPHRPQVRHRKYESMWMWIRVPICNSAKNAPWSAIIAQC